MNRRSLATIAVGAAALIAAAGANSADIKLISSPGIRGSVSELVRQFESGTSHKVATEFDVFAILKRRIDAGETFDVAILSPALIEELIQAGRIVAETRVTYGRTGMGIAARKGAAKRDVSSPEAFKRTMLDAKAVAYSKEGGSGKIFLSALERVGIAGEMKGKVHAVGNTLQAILDGNAELAVTGVGLILADPAVELVGPLPADLQTYVTFTLGANAASKELEAARALIRFMTAPAAAPVLKAYGVEPGSGQ